MYSDIYQTLTAREPRAFYHYFLELTQIPRQSGHEQAAAEYVCREARAHGLAPEVDAEGNVFLRVPATAGLEDRPALLIQSHLDMVAAQEPGREFDFLSDPIELEIVDNYLHGVGTNLGSDNGVGAALMLAAAFGGAAHPALELLFTVREETGLYGIRGFDTHKLTARRMINTDCGSSHNLCVSSAGCKKCRVEAGFPTPDASGETLRIAITGGQGGHGGLMIAAGRMCGANLLGDLLTRLCARFPIRLAAASHTGKAIIPAAEALICVPDGAAVRAYVDAITRELLLPYRETDPGVRITVEASEAVPTALTPADTATAARALAAVRSAPTHMDGDVIITSACVTGFALAEGAFTLDYSVRSESDAERDALNLHYRDVLAGLGLTAVVLDGYDGWPYRPQSPLRDTLAAIHRRIHGREPSFERIHGGIETGIILGAVPDMDAVGFKPSTSGAHTTAERLYLDEVGAFWEVFVGLLGM